MPFHKKLLRGHLIMWQILSFDNQFRKKEEEDDDEEEEEEEAKKK